MHQYVHFLQWQSTKYWIEIQDCNCSVCQTETGTCWACLTTEQQVFNDVNLTSPVSDGYYLLKYEIGEPNAVWHIVGGYPQPEGFFN